MTSRVKAATRYLRAAALTGFLGTLASCGGDGSVPVTQAHQTTLFVLGNDANGAGLLQAFVAGTDGALGAPSSPVTTGQGACAMAVDQAQTHVYVLNCTDGTMYLFALAKDVAPTQNVTIAGFTPTGARGAATIVEAGAGGQTHYLYAASGTQIAQWAIAGDGTLTPLSPGIVTLPAAVSSMVVDPSGATVQVVTTAAAQNVLSYAIGNDGGLAPSNTLTIPGAAALSYDSRADQYLLASNCLGNTCVGGLQSVGPPGGSLVAGASLMTTGAYILGRALAFPSNAPVGYLLANQLDVDFATGQLWTFAPGNPPTSLATPVAFCQLGVDLVAAGQWLYVLTLTQLDGCQSSSPVSIARFTIAADGSLSATDSAAVITMTPVALALVGTPGS